jgi:3-oxoacyl-ACP reductase-like protein
LGSLSSVPTDKKSVGSYLDQWMAIVSTTLGVNIGRASTASSGGQVDATLLNDLHDKILGKDGVLIRNMRMMAEDLGHPFDDSTPISEPYTGLEVIRGELSDDYLDRLRPMFSGEKHSPFLSVWAAAHSKASLMLHQSLSEEVDLDALEKTCIRLRSFTNIPRVNAALQYNISVLKDLNRMDLVDMFTSVLTEDGISPLPLECTRPKVRLSSNGDFSYSEEPRMSSEEFVQWVQSSMVADSETYWKESLTQLHAKQGAFEQLTVLITGASPDSIAIFKFFRNQVVATHEPCSTNPTNNSATHCNVMRPLLLFTFTLVQ